ncbi:hypothetical protein [Paenibacillus sp. tmac-D7]|uniref:hypothetical protein n=1 Tax=Paenibacillus sp. tmac-D7 TaxID=2591462 RepID=UPI0011419FC5|nr:hypothetical protein [Paenibacillus sp. tmac-D7]
MLVKMRQEAFNALDDEALGTACVDPLIKAYKEIQTRGDDFSTGLFKELSRGQKALFVFRAYYNHVMKSDANFYWWSAYFMAQPERWSGLKSGLRFFGDRNTLHVLESLEEILKKRNHPRSLENFDVSANDLHHDPELMSLVKPLFDNLHETVWITHKIIGTCIRSNPNDFVQFEID